jgi:tricorn protease-like protein
MRPMKRARTLCGALLVAISISLVSAANAAHPGRNGLIAYVDGGSIYSIYPDGSHKKKLTVPQQDTYRLGTTAYPTWSPNGKTIAFIAIRTPLSGGGEPETDLFVMNADGSDVKYVAYVARAADFGASSGALSWSPDNSEIAYTRSYLAYGMPVRQVAFVRVDGRAGRDLRLLGETWAPAWSPDGRTIVFGAPNRTLDAVDSDGYNRRTLIHEVQAARPDWSPDGTKLLFDDRQVQSGTGTVYTANADGSEVRAVYQDDSTIGGYAASWSPDGTKIVLTVQDNDFAESIKYLKPDGTVQGLARTPVLGAMPDWQPCGQGVRCPVTTPCVVPRVVGLSFTRARTALRKAHCAVGTIKRLHHVALGKAVVLKQSPRAKTGLPNGAKVNLVLRRRR